MATDTSSGQDTDTINIDMSTLLNSSMSANGLTYQDLYSVGSGTGGYTYTTAQPWAISTNGADTTMSVKGDADFGGDVRVQGRSLAEFMQQVKQRLNMLQPNPELEREWDQLRELGEQYRQLEQELAEKAEMWGRLKR